MTLHEKGKTDQLRAAVYIRVSTPDQMKGYGPDFQLADCKTALERDECSLKDEHIFIDSQTGGTDERKDWQRLLEAARAGEIDVVYFWKLDRMMRDEYYYFVNEKELHDLNVELRFATQDLHDPFNRAVQVAVAAEEKRRIRERTQRGRVLAAKDGKWVWGSPAYGLEVDKETKKLRAVPKETKWVKKFYEWVVFDGLPLSGVQRRANELGVPTYSRRARKEESLKGYWHKKSIARILSNPIYTGAAYSFRFKRGVAGVNRFIDPKTQHPKEQWICMEAPKIISKKLFERCQEQLKKNREYSRRNIKGVYLFNKLLYCGRCGLKLFAATKVAKKKEHNNHKYYFGNRGAKWEKVLVKSSRCQYCGQIGEVRLEPVWEAIRGLLTSPKEMVEALKIYENRAADDETAKEKALGVAKDRLAAVRVKLRRLDRVYLESTSLSDEEYERRRAECRKGENETKREIERFQNGITKIRTKGDDIEALILLARKFQKKLATITYDRKSEIIHSLVEKIIIGWKRDEAEVELHIPSPYTLKNTATTRLSDNRVDGGHSSGNRRKRSVLSDNQANNGHTKQTTIVPFVFKVPLANLKERRRKILKRNRLAALGRI